MLSSGLWSFRFGGQDDGRLEMAQGGRHNSWYWVIRIYWPRTMIEIMIMMSGSNLNGNRKAWSLQFEPTTLLSVTATSWLGGAQASPGYSSQPLCSLKYAQTLGLEAFQSAAGYWCLRPCRLGQARILCLSGLSRRWWVWLTCVDFDSPEAASSGLLIPSFWQTLDLVVVRSGRQTWR
jgi:hypothetical protein